MNYEIWLQILMELALSVSGEQDSDALMEKACRSFHRKLDCTHVVILALENGLLEERYISPRWAKRDSQLKIIAMELGEKCRQNDLGFALIEADQHFYYGFELTGYGALVFGKGQEMPLKLIRELKPILDMFAINILACQSFKRQNEVEKELRKQKETIEYLAYHDSLTTLPNRRKFLEILNEWIETSEIGGIILLDIDDFKGINDTLGHAFGDKILRRVAEQLQKIVSEDIAIARFGGDEFLILVRNQSKTEIEWLAQNILALFHLNIAVGLHDVEVRFSMGIALYPHDATEVNQLIINADLALYAVKNKGKNNYAFFDYRLSERMLYKSEIDSFIKKALMDDGFKLVYQPQIDSVSCKIVGYEALIRLKYHGISPSEFIPIAEENRSIIPIGRLVTEKVIKQLSRWEKSGYCIKPISINFSAIQILDTSYIEYLEERLNHYQVNANLIEIEITENVFMENELATITFLNRLRGLGVSIAIDDFGTGYSSLSYLTFLPLDKIKLDRSIIKKFLELDTIKVMNSLIQLAHSLNLKVVAEGIETREQFERIREGLCDTIQGFYFSGPLEVEEIEANFVKDYTLERIYVED